MDLLAYLEGEPGEPEVKRVRRSPTDCEPASSSRRRLLRQRRRGAERTVGVSLIVPPPSDDPEPSVAVRRGRAPVEAVEQFTASSDDVFAWGRMGRSSAGRGWGARPDARRRSNRSLASTNRRRRTFPSAADPRPLPLAPEGYSAAHRWRRPVVRFEVRRVGIDFPPLPSASMSLTTGASARLTGPAGG